MLEILGWQIVFRNSIYPSLYFVIHPLGQQLAWSERRKLQTGPRVYLGISSSKRLTPVGSRNSREIVVLCMIDRSVTVVSND